MTIIQLHHKIVTTFFSFGEFDTPLEALEWAAKECDESAHIYEDYEGFWKVGVISAEIVGIERAPTTDLLILRSARE